MPEDEYQKYERACKRIKEDNAKLLDDFDRWLSGKGVSTKTIRKHKDNVDFYINTFLLNEDAIPAKEGASHIAMFLGYRYPSPAILYNPFGWWDRQVGPPKWGI